MKLSIKVALSSCALVATFGAFSAMAQEMSPLRDGRTGKVWTPEMANGEQASVPSSSADRAFNPQAQNVHVEGIVVQHPRATLMGTLPITAGPSVPVVTLDAPSLQVIPGREWLSILYVTNNSATTVNAVVACHFTNGGQRVEDTRIVVPPAGPGERLGVPVRGPRYDIFVDQVRCELVAPT